MYNISLTRSICKFFCSSVIKTLFRSRQTVFLYFFLSSLVISHPQDWLNCKLDTVKLRILWPPKETNSGHCIGFAIDRARFGNFTYMGFTMGFHTHINSSRKFMIRIFSFLDPESRAVINFKFACWLYYKKMEIYFDVKYDINIIY